LAEFVAALGWPHFAFLFGLVIVFVFRAQLKSLLGRVTSIDKTGIKTQPNPDIQREESKKLEAAHELMIGIGNSVVMQGIEERIRNDLAAKQLKIEDETSRVLVKHLAATIMSLEFEQIHSLVFGSQIYLLKRLNEVVGLGQTPESIKAHFENVQRLFNDAFSSWSQEKYLEFLFNRNLIALQDSRYHITAVGKEYLIWIAKNGSREDRSF
jgi:hypothetical protein